MKKLVISLSIIISGLMIGCNPKIKEAVPENTHLDLIDIEDVADEEVDQSDSITLPEGVDIDLTQLSSTMVYGEVFQMMATPTLYIDKVIRIEGEYSPYTDSATGNTYHMILITDALACCEQGMEFVLADGEYPKEGNTVIVTGEFQVYQENDYTYMHLIDAVLGE